MKVLLNQSKIMMLIGMILVATIVDSSKTSDKVAVILTSHDFFHTGTKLRESFLQKHYDVHLTEVHATKVLDIKDWSKTPLGEKLDGHYKQLIFIVAAHGSEQFGALIYWNSLLALVKLFEKKADEIFIHLNTCFSGDAAESWNGKLGPNVKVFTVSSCKGKKTYFDAYLMDWDISSQIFTGNFLHTTPYERFSNANIDKFRDLKCDSNISQLNAVIDKQCSIDNKCASLHIWKGEDEKLTKWDIVPKNLTVVNKPISNCPNPNCWKHKINLSYIKFTDQSCEAHPKPFDHIRTVTFNPHLQLVHDSARLEVPMIYNNESWVNIYDPIQDWKVRTQEITIKNTETGQPFYLSPVPKEFKENEIKPYATILDLNGHELYHYVNLNGELVYEHGLNQLKEVKDMKLGYYEPTSNIWILNDSYHGVCAVSNTDATGKECDCSGKICSDVEFCYGDTCNTNAKVTSEPDVTDPDLPPGPNPHHSPEDCFPSPEEDEEKKDWTTIIIIISVAVGIIALSAVGIIIFCCYLTKKRTHQTHRNIPVLIKSNRSTAQSV
jgi:hypothetical protein